MLWAQGDREAPLARRNPGKELLSLGLATWIVLAAGGLVPGDAESKRVTESSVESAEEPTAPGPQGTAPVSSGPATTRQDRVAPRRPAAPPVVQLRPPKDRAARPGTR